MPLKTSHVYVGSFVSSTQRCPTSSQVTDKICHGVRLSSGRWSCKDPIPAYWRGFKIVQNVSLLRHGRIPPGPRRTHWSTGEMWQDSQSCTRASRTPCRISYYSRNTEGVMTRHERPSTGSPQRFLSRERHNTKGILLINFVINEMIYVLLTYSIVDTFKAYMNSV